MSWCAWALPWLSITTDPGAPQNLHQARGDSLAELIPEGLLAGRRTWAIQAQNLFPVEPDFPPRLLRKWLLEPTMSFPSAQLDRVLTFFAAHLPRFRMVLKADNLDVDESVEPHFVLTLEGNADKVKALLAARYGQTTVPVSPSAAHLGYASGVGSESRKLYRRREELRIPLGLDAFGDELELHGLRHLCRGLDDDSVIGVVAHAHDEGLVELERMHGQVAQIAER